MSDRRPHILIVDDNPDALELLGLWLESEGYRAVPARHGAEALARLRVGALPLCVLLDLTMPVMDGWQFREVMLQDPRLRPVPVVVVTALQHPELPQQITALLHKPIDFDRLLALLEGLRTGATTTPSRSGSQG